MGTSRWRFYSNGCDSTIYDSKQRLPFNEFHIKRHFFICFVHDYARLGAVKARDKAEIQCFACQGDASEHSLQSDWMDLVVTRA